MALRLCCMLLCERDIPLNQNESPDCYKRMQSPNVAGDDCENRSHQDHRQPIAASFDAAPCDRGLRQVGDISRDELWHIQPLLLTSSPRAVDLFDAMIANKNHPTSISARAQTAVASNHTLPVSDLPVILFIVDVF